MVSEVTKHSSKVLRVYLADDRKSRRLLVIKGEEERDGAGATLLGLVTTTDERCSPSRCVYDV